MYRALALSPFCDSMHPWCMLFIMHACHACQKGISKPAGSPLSCLQLQAYALDPSRDHGVLEVTILMWQSIVAFDGLLATGMVQKHP